MTLTKFAKGEEEEKEEKEEERKHATYHPDVSSTNRGVPFSHYMNGEEKKKGKSGFFCRGTVSLIVITWLDID